MKPTSQIIELAEKAAEKSDYYPHKHGAVLYNRDGVIAVGFNHGVLHAERDALRRLGKKNLAGKVYLYVTRINGGRTSKPCPTCQKVIDRAGITKVYHT